MPVTTPGEHRSVARAHYEDARSAVRLRAPHRVGDQPEREGEIEQQSNESGLEQEIEIRELV